MIRRVRIGEEESHFLHRSNWRPLNGDLSTNRPNFLGFPFWPFSKWSVLVLTAPSEPRDCWYAQPSALATYDNFGTPHLICIGEIMP